MKIPNSVSQKIRIYTAHKNLGHTVITQCNSKSVKVLGYQTVQLGSHIYCESVSPGVVEMKQTTGGNERQLARPL